MRAFWLLVLGCSISGSAIGALYRHVDEFSNVSYSDRPQAPGHPELRLPPPNVSTPEARRQLELAQQASEREAQAEHDARMRRWAAAGRASPAGYSHHLSPSSRHYAAPAFTTYPVTFDARTPAQGNSSQGLRPSRFSHRAHSARH